MKRLAWSAFGLGCILAAYLFFTHGSSTEKRAPTPRAPKPAQTASARSDGFESANWAAPAEKKDDAPKDRLDALGPTTEAPKLPEGLKGVPIIMPAPEKKR